jgi:hypothetical protein
MQLDLTFRALTSSSIFDLRKRRQVDPELRKTIRDGHGRHVVEAMLLPGDSDSELRRWSTERRQQSRLPFLEGPNSIMSIYLLFLLFCSFCLAELQLVYGVEGLII